MKKKTSTVIIKPIEELPERSTLVEKLPEILPCSLCGKPLERIEGGVLVECKDKDEDGDWLREYVWDYSNAKTVPAPKDHLLCVRIVALMESIADTKASIAELHERLLELENYGAETTLLHRAKYWVGTKLHRLGGILQRE